MTTKLIGTNHMASEKEIIDLINKENPDIIAVEMCNERYKIHMKGKKREDKSIWGKIANKMTKVSNQAGEKYGGDMVTAMKVAEQKNIPLHLIDRDIDETKRLLKKISIREKLLIYASYLMTNKKKVKKMKKQAQNLQSDKQQMQKYIDNLKVNMPNIYKILIEDRNKYLYENIKKIDQENKDKKIIVFLGAGHIQEINRMLSEDGKTGTNQDTTNSPITKG